MRGFLQKDIELLKQNRSFSRACDSNGYFFRLYKK